MQLDRCLLGILLIGTPALADAQVPLARVDPNLLIGRNAHRSVETASTLPVPLGDIRPSSLRETVSAPTGVYISAIRVVGGIDIPSADLILATSSFVGHKLSTGDLHDLLETISGVARARGYIFASSIAPAQTIKANILVVELDEGHVDEVRLTGAHNKAVLAVIGTLMGHALRRSELERQLMLAQDLPGVSIGKVRYAHEGSKSILIVPVTYKRLAGRAWADNWGNRALGPVRTQLTLNFNGLFNDKDQLSVSDLVTPLEPKELNVIGIRYVYQMNNSGTDIAIYGTFGQTQSGGIWRQFNANGKSVSAGASIEQPLLRGRKASVWIGGEFNHFAVDQWFGGAKVRRERVSTASIAVNGYAPAAGGRIRAGAEATQGLDIFNATPGSDSLASRPNATGRFLMFAAWANWAGDLVGPFSAKLALTAQRSTRPLLAIEQIAIGGPIFGRAYDYSERSGDNGVLSSVEIQAKLWQRSHGLILWAQAYGFADAGNVTNLRNSFGTGTLYSAGFGARATLTSSVQASLEAAFPINTDRYETRNMSPRVSASMAKSF